VSKVSVGVLHACALLEDGDVQCWGDGRTWPIGNEAVGVVGDDEVPSAIAAVSLGGPAQAIDTSIHSCAILDGGAVRCWGPGLRGALGYGDLEDVGDDEPPSARAPVDVGFEAVEIALGSTSCARAEDGAVRCWGPDENGALGRGIVAELDCWDPVYESFECERDPLCCIGDDEPASAAPLLALGAPARQITHSCALLEGGDVRCWGRNESGQLGYGHTEVVGDDELPSDAAPVSLGGVAVQIAGRAFHTCALLETGDVRCWGAEEH